MPSSPPTPTEQLRHWLRLRLADPGSARLQYIAAFVASIGAATLVAWAIATSTDQIRIDAALSDGSSITVPYHPAAMILAAILALVMVIIPLPPDRKTRGTVLGIFPILYWIGTLIGTAFNQTTFTSIAGLCVLGTVLVLLQRSPRLVLMGLPTFFGSFMGIFTDLEFRHAGWVLLIAVASGLAVTFVQVIACPNGATLVERTFRSFDIACARLLDRIAALLLGPPDDERHRRRVRHAARRVEMLALLGDGQLASSADKLPPHTLDTLHLRAFDREAALSSLTRAALDYDGARHPGASNPEPVATIVAGIGHLVDDDTTSAERAVTAAVATTVAPAATTSDDAALAAYRVAVALAHLTDGWHSANEIIDEATRDAPTIYEPAVTLEATGELPGTENPTLALHADQPTVLGFPAPIFQRAVRMAIALSAASAIGYWISQDRWYYGLFGAFSVMMTANGTAEHLRIGIERALGTAVGAIIGVAIASGFEDQTVITYILLFLAVGIAFYFQRPSDALSTAGLTVMVMFLYVQMQTYEDVVLWDRVAETAMGGAVGILVAFVVFRTPTERIARCAARGAFDELDGFLRAAVDTAAGHQPATALRSAARRFQQAVWTFGQTVGPAPYVRFGDNRPTATDLSVLSALGNDAARLARDIDRAPDFPSEHRAALEEIATGLSGSVQALSRWVSGARQLPPLERTTRLAELELAVRSLEASDSDAWLTVLHDLVDIEEHLFDMLAYGDTLEVPDGPRAPRPLPVVPLRFKVPA